MLKKFCLMATGATLLTLSSISSIEVAQAASLRLLAQGLDGPRGLAFAPNGDLYVTEAGRGGDGPCIPALGQPGANICYGPTSAISRILDSGFERVITGLPSLALPDGNEAIGAQDIAFDPQGKPYAVIGLGGTAGDRDTILGIPDFGHLVAFNSLNPGSTWTRVADFAAFETANNPAGAGIDSNPFSVVVQEQAAYVVDAGANTLVQASLDGTQLATTAVFPSRLVPSPFPEPPTIAMESVPTSVRIGPDGAFYVSELTGFPFPQNGARIYRLNRNGQREVYADGFTQIVDFAFDRKGGLYVLEYASQSLLAGDLTGGLIYVAADGTRTEIATGALTSPTGLAIGEDGAVYVSNQGFIAGEGQVLRIDPETAIQTPEPISGLGLVGLAVVSILHRKRQQPSVSQ